MRMRTMTAMTRVRRMRKKCLRRKSGKGLKKSRKWRKADLREKAKEEDPQNSGPTTPPTVTAHPARKSNATARRPNA